MAEVITANFQNTAMQKEQILQKIKEKGCRITKQRRMLLDVILKEECASCKEIYYKAKKKDAGIGTATVYRMVSLLEDIGVISRKNMYKIACGIDRDREIACVVELDDHTVCRLNAQCWFRVMLEGMRACGYADKQHITGILIDELYPG